MAAIIIALRRRLQLHGGVSEELDADGDGKISTAEIQQRLPMLAIRVKPLLHRLQIEKDMIDILYKLPNFCLCVFCFIIALVEFAPPASTADIHRHLRSHFELSSAYDIKDFDGIYAYMEKFEKQNEELQAAGSHYWCEDRYAEHIWDKDLLIPHWTCASPRQHALTLSDNAKWKWTYLDGAGTLNKTGGDTSSCLDNDAGLQEAEGNSSLTCESFHHACEISIGIQYCPKTCGYCGPFVYRNYHEFQKTQVTMLPVMVYQTRFNKQDCHDFAETYDKQPYNTELWQVPALDGEKDGAVLNCIDPSAQQDTDYAISLDCPPGAPSSKCSGDLKVNAYAKHTFHGVPVYPKLLTEPHHDVLQMQAVNYLDVQTGTISLSTMIYTEGVEIFTSLTVDFSVSTAGNINAEYKLVSYRDMLNGSKTTFIVCLIVTSIGALVGVLLSARYLWTNRQECKMGYVLYELISRSALFVYPLILLISWTQQVPMSKEYDDLLHSFLDIPSASEEVFEQIVQQYFDVKSHIWSETNWMKRHRVVAYFILYAQFLQLIFYMNAHPKLGVLTATVVTAMSHLVHFLMVFWILFLMLGFMAHWMLGGSIDGFASFSGTIEAQTRMLFGEFIFADGAAELTYGLTFMYWLYAGSFLLIIFFSLLNFFLAIIVDAFVAVKENIAELPCGYFLTDLWLTLVIESRWRARGWPDRVVLMRALRSTMHESKGRWIDGLSQDEDGEDDAEPEISCSDLLAVFDNLGEDKLSSMLSYYMYISPKMLRKVKETPEAPTNTIAPANGSKQHSDRDPTEVRPHSGLTPEGDPELLKQVWPTAEAPVVPPGSMQERPNEDSDISEQWA